jgi:hypothetical protein
VSVAWAFVMRHRPTALVLALAVAYLVVNLGLALGEWDRHRVTFVAETGVDVRLRAGDERIVYMPADQSEPMDFDFYPSDYGCQASGPDGRLLPRRIHHQRQLDLWRPHQSVVAFEAEASGVHHIGCGLGWHVDAPLVLASPPRLLVGTDWVAPDFAVALLVVVVFGCAVAQIVRVLGSALVRGLRLLAQAR